MNKPTEDKPHVVIVLRRKFLITMFIVWGFLFLSIVSLFQYVGYADRKGNERERKKDQQFCQLFGRLDKQYQATPPPSPQGKVFAEDIHQLVNNLDCPQ